MSFSAVGRERMILLLRGINVGSHHRVSMPDLRALCAEMGYDDVTTHLQSGNVVLGGVAEPEDRVARRMERELQKRFNFDIPVITRTQPALADVLAANPLCEVVTDPGLYIVTFLNSPPAADSVLALQPEDFGPEQFVVRGREVYQWCPGGQHHSPLVKELAKAGITTTGTTRNWRTVEWLAGLP